MAASGTVLIRHGDRGGASSSRAATSGASKRGIRSRAVDVAVVAAWKRGGSRSGGAGADDVAAPTNNITSLAAMGVGAAIGPMAAPGGGLEGAAPLSNQPLQLAIPPQGHRVEWRRRLGGGLAAERQNVGRTIRSGTLASPTVAGWCGAAVGAWYLSHPVSANCGHFGGRRVNSRHASQASRVCNSPRLDYSRGLRFWCRSDAHRRCGPIGHPVAVAGC